MGFLLVSQISRRFFCDKLSQQILAKLFGKLFWLKNFALSFEIMATIRGIFFVLEILAEILIILFLVKIFVALVEV